MRASYPARIPPRVARSPVRASTTNPRAWSISAISRTSWSMPCSVVPGDPTRSAWPLTWRSAMAISALGRRGLARRGVEEAADDHGIHPDLSCRGVDELVDGRDIPPDPQFRWIRRVVTVLGERHDLGI